LVADRVDPKEAAWAESHVPQVSSVWLDLDVQRLSGRDVDGDCGAGHPQRLGLDVVSARCDVHGVPLGNCKAGNRMLVDLHGIKQSRLYGVRPELPARDYRR
jgi:hypothetical protein